MEGRVRCRLDRTRLLTYRHEDFLHFLPPRVSPTVVQERQQAEEVGGEVSAEEDVPQRRAGHQEAGALPYLSSLSVLPLSGYPLLLIVCNGSGAVFAFRRLVAFFSAPLFLFCVFVFFSLLLW